MRVCVRAGQIVLKITLSTFKVLVEKVELLIDFFQLDFVAGLSPDSDALALAVSSMTR